MTYSYRKLTTGHFWKENTNQLLGFQNKQNMWGKSNTAICEATILKSSE